MKLDDLLRHDPEAAALFDGLPAEAQDKIRRTCGDVDSLAALRDRTIHIMDHDGPFYAHVPHDGTELDPELKADWTQEHQA